ncbi:hypothetical protein LguiA_025891 [Lonicera macranthoides]
MCWVVAANGNTESNYMIDQNISANSDAAIKLSEQEFVDCYFDRYPPNPKKDGSEKYDKHGFRKGAVTGAFEYLKEHGISLEGDYPWSGKKEACIPKTEPSKAIWIKDYANLKHSSVFGVMKELRKHPVAASILVTKGFGQLKKGQIYDEVGDIFHGHALLLVGYGLDEATKTGYFTVKNSWGPTWCDGGFGKVKWDLIFDACYPIGPKFGKYEE